MVVWCAELSGEVGLASHSGATIRLECAFENDGMGKDFEVGCCEASVTKRDGVLLPGVWRRWIYSA